MLVNNECCIESQISVQIHTRTHQTREIAVFWIRRCLHNHTFFACVIFNSQLGSQNFEQIYQMASADFPLVMAIQSGTKRQLCLATYIHVKFNVVRIHPNVNPYHHRYCETPAPYITDFLHYFSKKKTLPLPFMYSHENSQSRLSNVTNIQYLCFCLCRDSPAPHPPPVGPGPRHSRGF